MLSLLPVRGMAFTAIVNRKAISIGDPRPPEKKFSLDKGNTT